VRRADSVDRRLIRADLVEALTVVEARVFFPANFPANLLRARGASPRVLLALLSLPVLSALIAALTDG